MTNTTQASPGLKANIVTRMAQLSAGEATYEALSQRANILSLVDEAMAAVITPKDTGCFSHAQRAALACRISRLNNSEPLASFFSTSAAPEQNICDPAFDGAGDGRLAAILSFTDLVSTHPKDATGADVSSLLDAGIMEADIVRLAELNAFMAFLIRVVDGLTLMRATP